MDGHVLRDVLHCTYSVFPKDRWNRRMVTGRFANLVHFTMPNLWTYNETSYGTATPKAVPMGPWTAEAHTVHVYPGFWRKSTERAANERGAY